MKTTTGWRIISFTAAALLLSLATAHARAPSGRYVIGGQGQQQTVFDTKTRLTWERSVGDPLTRQAAQDRCAGLGATLGGAGWRLPTIKELYTIMDFSVVNPTTLIDADAFPQTPPAPFWTTAPGNTQLYQCVSFFDGRNGCFFDLNVSRCVR
jgi:hypothetical protein